MCWKPSCWLLQFWISACGSFVFIGNTMIVGSFPCTPSLPDQIKGISYASTWSDHPTASSGTEDLTLVNASRPRFSSWLFVWKAKSLNIEPAFASKSMEAPRTNSTLCNGELKLAQPAMTRSPRSRRWVGLLKSAVQYCWLLSAKQMFVPQKNLVMVLMAANTSGVAVCLPFPGVSQYLKDNQQVKSWFLSPNIRRSTRWFPIHTMFTRHPNGDWSETLQNYSAFHIKKPSWFWVFPQIYGKTKVLIHNRSPNMAMLVKISRIYVWYLQWINRKLAQSYVSYDIIWHSFELCPKGIVLLKALRVRLRSSLRSAYAPAVLAYVRE